MDDLTPRGKRRVFRVICYLAHADGEVDPAERETVEALRVRLRIGKDEAAALEAEAADGKKIQLKTTEAEAEAAVECLAEVMLADGVLHPAEAKRIKRVAKAVGVGEKALAKVIKRAMVARNQAMTASDEDAC